jgi:hypothetical protein
LLEGEFTEIDDDIRAVRPEVGSVIALSDAYHKQEPAGVARFDTNDGVFEDVSVSGSRGNL